MIPDPFTTIGVLPNATRTEIRRTYKSQLGALNELPDGEDKSNAIAPLTAAFQEIVDDWKMQDEGGTHRPIVDLSQILKPESEDTGSYTSLGSGYQTQAAPKHNTLLSLLIWAGAVVFLMIPATGLLLFALCMGNLISSCSLNKKPPAPPQITAPSKDSGVIAQSSNACESPKPKAPNAEPSLSEPPTTETHSDAEKPPESGVNE